MKLEINPYNFTSIIRELLVIHDPLKRDSWKTLALIELEHLKLHKWKY